MFISGCGENAADALSSEYIVSNFTNISNNGELYTDSEGRLNFCDFTTMKSSVLCPNPNCTHSSPDTCSSFGISNHPIIFDGSLHFFDSEIIQDGKEFQYHSKVYKANADGTNRSVIAEADDLNIPEYERMQKSYTVDCLTHKRAKNTGQKAKYHMQDCHDAIIDRETWDRVRLELAKHSVDALHRKDGRHRENYRTKYCFSQLLKCGCCGGTYKRTIWKFGGQPVGVWRCGIRLDYGNQRCKQSPSIHEDNLHRAVISAINAAIRNAADLTETAEHSIVRKHAEIVKLSEEYDDVTAQLREIESRREDILSLISGDSFDLFRDELKVLNAAEAEYAEKLTDLERRQNDLQLSIHQTYAAREQFEAMQQLAAFDELVVRRLVEEIIVLSKTKIRVVFHGGLEYVCDVEKGRRKV